VAAEIVSVFSSKTATACGFATNANPNHDPQSISLSPILAGRSGRRLAPSMTFLETDTHLDLQLRLGPLMKARPMPRQFGGAVFASNPETSSIYIFAGAASA
jgi:hypothetical protein